jgi:fermentation-respiration switch protein FrsA (DUF1100 family)
LIGTWARTGVWFASADPADALVEIGSRPILLIHGSADTQDLPERTQDLYDRARAMGLHIELHWCAGAGHGHLNDTCPTDLATWTAGFFDRILRPKGAAQQTEG